MTLVSPSINVNGRMIGEDSPAVGLRMVAGRAFRSLCCKAKGRRSEGLLINCPEPVPCQSCRWVNVMKSKSRVTIFYMDPQFYTFKKMLNHKFYGNPHMKCQYIIHNGSTDPCSRISQPLITFFHSSVQNLL